MKKSYSHPEIDHVELNTAESIQATSPDIEVSTNGYSDYRGAKSNNSFGSWSNNDNEEDY